jgi:prolipoprotein diacylglyceryltransferase
VFPTLHLPIGRGLGAVLLLLAVAWWWACSLGIRRSLPWATPRLRLAAAAFLAPGVFFLVVGTVAVAPLPLYGLAMATGAAVAIAFAARFARERGIRSEAIVDLAIIGLVCGLAGSRIVHIVEYWDQKFADAPPGRRSPGPVRPLARGDTLVLRTPAGEARVAFEGDERGAADVLARIVAQAGAVDVGGRLVTTRHRGANGIEEHVRGLVLRTGRVGHDAWLEIEPGPAQAALALAPGKSQGRDVPLIILLDLSEGGLTYFGAAFGVLLGWAVYLRRKRLPTLLVLDALAPTLALGLFFGRLGCFARGCCFGRESGDFPGVVYPPFSLPWQDMANERLSVVWDPLLASRALTPAMAEALGPLAQGTPPLHAAQLYEGLGVLLIFLLLAALRHRLKVVGTSFLLLVLLQAPLRFVVEHLRRDHDVFFPVAGYPLTESQIVAILAVLAAGPALVWLQRRGPMPAPAVQAAPATEQQVGSA